MKRKGNDDIILSARGIVNRFGEQKVHDGIDLAIRRGEILGIAGGSGTGKSVLLNTLAGLRQPDAGEVSINGKPVTRIAAGESAALMGMLFQEGALFSSLSVADNIMLPLREYTALSEEDRTALAELKLALVGLPADTGAKYPNELSGGMAKRAAMARALAMDPLILFLDEPTANLDPVSAAAFDDMLCELNRSLGITVVMVTHDLNTLFSICDRVAVLMEGRILVDTLPELLKRDDAWIQEFFNGPRGLGAAITAKEMHGNG